MTALVCSAHAAAQPDEGVPAAQRRIHTIAQHEGEIALAASVSYLFYGGIPKARGHPGLPGAKARVICEALPDSQRLLIPECIALQEFDAMKAGDMESRAELFKPGEARSKAAAWLDRFDFTSAEVSASWADAEVRFRFKARWPDQVMLLYHIEGISKDRGRSPTSMPMLRLKRDPEAERFWCVDYNLHRATLFQTIFANIVNYVPGYNKFPTTPEPPRGAAAWRVTPAPEEETERRYAITRIDDSDPDAVGEHDFVLYIREDTLPDTSEPFIFAAQEDEGFDEACRTLQRQLTLTLAANDGGIPIEACLEAWHPAMHERLRRAEQRNLERAQRGVPGRSELVSFGGIPPSMIPEIRLVSRVVMDDAVVWYGWAPPRPAAGFGDREQREILRRRRRALRDAAGFDEQKRAYQPGPWGPGMTAGGEEIGVVHIVQRRDDDGVLRLTLPDAHVPNQENALATTEIQLAMQVVENDDLAKAIVRAHLEDDEP